MSSSEEAAGVTDDRHFIVRFFDAPADVKDAGGRTLGQILSWTDEALEKSHDYIQILFPLPESSGFNYIAPIVTKKVFEAFRQRENLREAQRGAFVRYLNFLGLDLVEDGDTITVVKASNWDSNSPNWVKRSNHNHLRITRVIRSLRILGSAREAEAFYQCLSSLQDVVSAVSPRSLEFWEMAAKQPLRLAPGEDESAAGISWLA